VLPANPYPDYRAQAILFEEKELADWF